MKKPMFTTIIILAVIILVVGGYLAYKYWKNRGQATKSEIVEYRDFSCPGMSGFTFKYPVFKDWEVNRIENSEQDNCSIVLNYPEVIGNLYAPPKIGVIKTEVPNLINDNGLVNFNDRINVKLSSNPNGIFYEHPDSKVSFFTKDALFTIETISVFDKYGFNSNLFFKTVIESFRLTDQNYTIFPAEYENSWLGKGVIKRFTPTDQEAQNALSILREFLKNKKELKPSDSYKTQFFGYINAKGEKIIWANYFCNSYNSAVDWKNDLVFVMDGGNCFFQAEVNLNNQKIFNFRVNGES